jgi:hypothetical protein
VPIILEDLERIFENAEDKLANAALKICLNQPPCKDAILQISSWLNSGRLGLVEMFYAQPSGGSSATKTSIDTGSDRVRLIPISAERFRGYVTDVDWTQMGNQRQGTFTLDNGSEGKSRIPRMSSAQSHNHDGSGEELNNVHPSHMDSGILDETDLAMNEDLSKTLRECLERLQRDEACLSADVNFLREALQSLNHVNMN